MLTGLLYCGCCGNRLCYSHNTTHRKLADGTEKVYNRNLYRCYRRISSPTTCDGPSGYEMGPINEAVEIAVMNFLKRISVIPREDLIALAGILEVRTAEVTYKQSVKDFEETQRQINALEEEAMKGTWSRFARSASQQSSGRLGAAAGLVCSARFRFAFACGEQPTGLTLIYAPHRCERCAPPAELCHHSLMF